MGPESDYPRTRGQALFEEILCALWLLVAIGAGIAAGLSR